MHTFIISTVLTIYPSYRFQPSKSHLQRERLTHLLVQQSQQNESPDVVSLHLVTHFIDLVVEISLFYSLQMTLRAETIRRDVVLIKWRFGNICVQ
jgi:hypothetical protein